MIEMLYEESEEYEPMDNSMRHYEVSLEPKNKKDMKPWLSYLKLDVLRCTVAAPSMADACLKAEDYFSEKLGTRLMAANAFEWDEDKDYTLEEKLDMDEIE